MKKYRDKGTDISKTSIGNLSIISPFILNIIMIVFSCLFVDGFNNKQA
ncbi:MAG: hypothetical protein HRT66_02475 [Flavobacteriaceae bacterium]|nr:hypothetical protein [Flavobacteriaceae bacterium]